MAYTTAGIARLGASTTKSRIAASASSIARVTSCTLRTCAGNVTGLAAAVALLAGESPTVAAASRTTVGTITRDMTLLTTFVARLGLDFHRAITRNMTLHATVVAGRSPCLGAVSSLMTDCLHEDRRYGTKAES